MLATAKESCTMNTEDSTIEVFKKLGFSPKKGIDGIYYIQPVVKESPWDEEPDPELIKKFDQATKNISNQNNAQNIENKKDEPSFLGNKQGFLKNGENNKSSFSGLKKGFLNKK